MFYISQDNMNHKKYLDFSQIFWGKILPYKLTYNLTKNELKRSQVI